MSDVVTFDNTGRTCPECKSVWLHFTFVPEHRREHGNTTEYMPSGRDYHCRNCGAEWFLFTGDDQRTRTEGETE